MRITSDAPSVDPESAKVQMPPAGSRPADSGVTGKGICWLDDSAFGPESAAAVYARLRGMDLVCGGSLPERATAANMIAISASRLHELGAGRIGHLGDLVASGVTLYVRGIARQSPALLDLRPFDQSRVTIGQCREAVSYRLTSSPLIPAALRRGGEQAGNFEAAGADHLPSQAEVLLKMRHVDGVERATVFVVRHGSGQIVYDLHPEDESRRDTSVVRGLARPQQRHREIGALLAANQAVSLDPDRPSAVNICIDDRPAAYDYFSLKSLNIFLSHIDNIFPGAHTDFGWTPCHLAVSRRYIAALKKFSTGFVWHGFHRHVDHRGVGDGARELEQGKRMVSLIEQRFKVRLQRIMVFPFEKSGPGQFAILEQSGFAACVQEPNRPPDPPEALLYEQGLLPAQSVTAGFIVLHRYPAPALSEERMLAMAILQLPIIAYAHPRDIDLRRFPRPWERSNGVSHFDHVLQFARWAGLRPCSLEEIAGECAGSALSYTTADHQAARHASAV